MKDFILNNIPLILIGLFSLIEVTPIKISPLEIIGKKLNKQLDDKVGSLEEKIDANHQNECKILISDFVQDYLNGEHKTRTQWIAIINLADEYINNGWNSEIREDAIFLKEEYSKLYLKKEGK
ncbi:MAG: hypothetical protein OSJ70_05025 [Bacilli bacterium]|nr:hypothetical protein [Bacilli bacterium]